MRHQCRILPFLLVAILCCGWSALTRISTAQQVPAVVSDENLSALLIQMHANLRANEELARQYACDDSVHEEYFNKSGKKTKEKSEKVESVFANGLLYHQIVEENGKPLSQKRQVSLQKHEDAISEIGSRFDFIFDLRDGNPRDSIYSALPICCLTTLFENQVVRHESINGRDNLVVESVPKASPPLPSGRETTALDWKETTWIDGEYLMPTRLEVELLKDNSFLLKGTILQQNYLRLEEADEVGHPTQSVWLENHAVGRNYLKFPWLLESETFEDTSYNFKRFKADTRVLTDSMRVLDPEGPKKNP
jgi:hypothetical protein